MESDKSIVTRDLMEAFSRFKRFHWNSTPIEGLKHSEIVVLFVLKHEVIPGTQGLKVSEISSILQVTSPSITQLVKSLESAGYVERNADPDDRRAVRIKLTDQGENLVNKAKEDFNASFARLVEHLGLEKSNQLAGLLTEVFTYLSKNQK